MYGEVTAFIKPNYIISKKTGKLSGTQALRGVWGEAMLLAAAEQLCVRIALARVPLIMLLCLGQGVWHWLPHFPGLGLRGAAPVWAMFLLRLH